MTIREVRQKHGLTRKAAAYALSFAGPDGAVADRDLVNYEFGRCKPHYYLALYMAQQSGFPGEWGRAALAQFYGRN